MFLPGRRCGHGVKTSTSTGHRVQTGALHTAPPARGSGRAGCPPGRGSRGPLPAALDTQMMRPAGQAGGGGESCAADVSRQREERPGCRTDCRGAGPLPPAQGWAQQALVSVGTARSARSPRPAWARPSPLPGAGLCEPPPSQGPSSGRAVPAAGATAQPGEQLKPGTPATTAACRLAGSLGDVRCGGRTWAPSARG